MTSRVLLVYAVVGSLLTTVPAVAEGRRKSRSEAKIAREAHKHEKEGLKQLQRGNFDRAIEELQIAYGLTQEPGLLFHIAEAYNAKQDYAQALYYYRQYRDQDAAGASRRKVDAVIDALAAMPGVDPSASTTATTTDPPPTGTEGTSTTGTPAEPPVEPPAIVTSPEPAEPLVAAPARRSDGSAGRGRRAVGLVVGGGGLALIGVGAYYAKVAADRSDEISQIFDDNATWSPSDAAKYDEGRSAETRSIVFAAAGGAALVTGAVIYYLGWRAGAVTRVELGPTAGGGSVRLTCAF